MIPMGGDPLGLGQLAGDPPPECAETLVRLKWCILGMMGFGAGRLVTGLGAGILGADFFALLNLFITIVMGTFLMKDDPHLVKFYTWLATTICQQPAQQGQGGLSCLIPFMMVDTINFIFDFLFKLAYAQVMPYGFFLLGSIAAQGAGAYFAYSAYKICKPQSGRSDGTEMESGGNYLQASDGGNARTVQSGGAGGGGGSNFAMFSGSGNRLGG
eukprot:TRINITY_DN46821_c0_g1_i1.p1 TRINITY_DN46821_c0_g1~~TRINITY_DN46821_c0_g1_i1.p1  ORF type:complete len:214 (-),score=49.44 TRINITY_DN46821_c0_g1_i1:147-788(-)